MRSSPSLLVVVIALAAACGSPAPTVIGTPAATGSAAVSAAPPSESNVPTSAPSAPTSAEPTLPTDTALPSPTLPPIGIIGVECLTGQTVSLHVWITTEAGIPSYALWSTWGGGGDTTRSFPTPYTTHIDEVVEFTHALKDPEPGRIHEFGLAVTLVGVPDPIIVYAMEPENRCPGH